MPGQNQGHPGGCLAGLNPNDGGRTAPSVHQAHAKWLISIGVEVPSTGLEPLSLWLAALVPPE